MQEPGPNGHADDDRRPGLSVIMPVYNCASYLNSAVESILQQSFSDFEFIIIDDGSTDGSLRILQDFAKQDRRIRLISRPNRGLVHSLNEALDLTRGDFVARMDGDDISCPDRFEKQLRLLNESGGDICGGHYFYINEKDRLTKAVISPLDAESFPVYLSLSVPFAHGSVMFRRSFIERHRLRYGTKTGCAEDYALWIEFCMRGAKFCNVDDFIYKYRFHGVSFSIVRKGDYRRDTKTLRSFFVRNNRKLQEESIRRLMQRYADLSDREKELLIFSAYLNSLHNRNSLFFKVLFVSDPKHIVLCLLKLLIDAY